MTNLNNLNKLRIFLAGIFASVSFLSSSVATAQDLTVFSAVSTTASMNEIGKLYESKGLGKIRLSYGATSALAKQIENGAPVDIFLSADQEWMNYLEKKKLIKSGTRSNLLGNTLVLVAPVSSTMNLKIEPNFPLSTQLNGGRLAVGDPDHTAVGHYAKAALESLNVWKDIESKLARASSVSASLALVEQNEVAAGIVFGTEGMVSKKVKIIDTFPANTHPAITYPIAFTTTGQESKSTAFLKFLRSPEAVTIFKKYGFSVL